ncbi:hypothetical protein ACMAUO_14040 [Gluconacetobacter sp. Hr-1-5]|uniref:hypothetical protein n=1 Tax=Gluconacetobacter sp. Hr-1-5 TaxID=3395370 RepID=UPI003B525605
MTLPPGREGRPVRSPHGVAEGQWPFFRIGVVVAMATVGRPASGAPAASYFMPPTPTMAVPRTAEPGGVGAGEAGMAAARGGVGSGQSGYAVTASTFSLAPPASGGTGHVGPFDIEQSNASPVPMETGRTVTAAYPVKGVPGMDLTINMFAGHRETNTGSNVGTGALTAGMRIKW